MSRSDLTAPDVRLICFPAEGASAATFAGWKEKLPPGIEVLAVELPGRGTREGEAPRRELAPLLEQLASALCHELSGPPFVFFGHRNGGFLAFALAQHLAHRGLPVPSRVVVSQTKPPEPYDPNQRSQRDPTVPFRIPPLRPVGGVAPLGPRQDESLSSVELEELEEVGSVPPGVLNDPELSDMVVPPLEADLALRSRFFVEDVLVPSAIHVLVPEQDPDADGEERLREVWGAWTSGACEISRIPGGPRYVETQPRLFFDTLEDIVDVRDASGVRRFPRF